MTIDPCTFEALSAESEGQTLCSASTVGWRSLLLRQYESRSAHSELTTAAIPDQRVVLLDAGPVRIESRSGRWHRRARFDPGQLGLTAPGVECHLSWRRCGPVPHATTHVFLPGRLMRDTSAALLGREISDSALPDTLVTTDEVASRVVGGLVDGVRAGVDDLYAESAATFLAAHLLTRGRFASDAGRPREVTDLRVREALEYMHDNLQLPLTLAELAGVAGLSPFHFLRTFRLQVGEPPHRHLTSIRLSRAERHLRRSSMPVTEIAYLCGFSSSAHLSSAFRRRFGESPAAYRRSLDSNESTMRSATT